MLGYLAPSRPVRWHRLGRASREDGASAPSGSRRRPRVHLWTNGLNARPLGVDAPAWTSIDVLTVTSATAGDAPPDARNPSLIPSSTSASKLTRRAMNDPHDDHRIPHRRGDVGDPCIVHHATKVHDRRREFISYRGRHLRSGPPTQLENRRVRRNGRSHAHRPRSAAHLDARAGALTCLRVHQLAQLTPMPHIALRLDARARRSLEMKWIRQCALEYR